MKSKSLHQLMVDAACRAFGPQPQTTKQKLICIECNMPLGEGMIAGEATCIYCVMGVPLGSRT
jgi:hypothetical protein